ncbi:MAG: acylneuraminate cytidylyltransferase family protein [Actinomycetes bacterium]
MLDGERVLAVIPARGGSKGVPRKNVLDLGGKPLVAWSIETALVVDEIDRTIVSTDDDEIAGVARRYGAEVYLRPAHLSTDSALVIDALRDLMETLRAEAETGRVMVLLEPTCPFRSPADVRDCVAGVVGGGRDSMAAFKEADLNPHRAWTVVDGRPAAFIAGADPWLPRQQLPAAYQLSGAVYCFRTDRLQADGRGLLFGDAGAVIVPAERSVDIDTRADFRLAEMMLAKGGGT